MVVISQVLVLFMLIVVGYFTKKLGIISDRANTEFSNIVINVALPSFIITSMSFDFSLEILMNSLVLVLLSFIVYGFAIAVSKVFTRVIKVEGKSRDVYQYVCTFSNVGFMGYPVMAAVYGDIGVFYAAIYNLAFNALVWSYGVYILQRSTKYNKSIDRPSTEKKRIRDVIKAFMNPGLTAVLIGFTLFLFSIKLPDVIFSTLKIIGSMTTPMSMMVIGFILSDIEMKSIIGDWRIFALASVRLLLIPLTVLAVLTARGYEGYLLGIPVLLTAMPAAANTAIISYRYDSDYQLASKLIFVSTLLSVVTIPFMITLL